MSDPLTPEERSGLTVWGVTFSAQIRGDGLGMSLAFHSYADAPVSNEEGLPVILPPPDVEKLRELLNEAAAR